MSTKKCSAQNDIDAILDLGKKTGTITSEQIEAVMTCGAGDEALSELLSRAAALGIRCEEATVPDKGAERRSDTLNFEKEAYAESDKYMVMSSFKYLLRDIHRYKLLTKEEEVELSKKAKAGDLEARDRMIVSNMGLAVSIASNLARKYKVDHKDMFYDMIGDGFMGLFKAVEMFEPERGYRFSTYAGWWIRQSIIRGIQDNGRTVRLPAYVTEEITKIVKVRERLSFELNKTPSKEEIAAEMELPVSYIQKMLNYANEMLSLDEPCFANAEKEYTRGYIVADSTIPSPEEVAINNVNAQDLYTCLNSLPERDANIIRLRYGLYDGRTYTLQEVADKYNLSRERIRQIEKKTLEKMSLSWKYKLAVCE